MKDIVIHASQGDNGRYVQFFAKREQLIREIDPTKVRLTGV